jgi:hypothetical protein
MEFHNIDTFWRIDPFCNTGTCISKSSKLICYTHIKLETVQIWKCPCVWSPWREVIRKTGHQALHTIWGSHGHDPVRSAGLNQCFRGTCCFHLQGKRISWACFPCFPPLIALPRSPVFIYYITAPLTSFTSVTWTSEPAPVSVLSFLSFCLLKTGHLKGLLLVHSEPWFLAFTLHVENYPLKGQYSLHPSSYPH